MHKNGIDQRESGTILSTTGEMKRIEKLASGTDTASASEFSLLGPLILIVIAAGIVHVLRNSINAIIYMSGGQIVIKHLSRVNW